MFIHTHTHNHSAPWIQQNQVLHMCPGPSNLTDEKIAGMSFSELIRIEGQLEQDIAEFGRYKHEDNRAACSGAAMDKVNLAIVRNARQKKQYSGDETELTQLKLALMNLTMKVTQLETMIMQFTKIPVVA